VTRGDLGPRRPRSIASGGSGLPHAPWWGLCYGLEAGLLTMRRRSVIILCGVLAFVAAVSVETTAAAPAEEVPAIVLELDTAAGDSPLRRSTLFPPIALDPDAPGDRWPAAAELTISRDCWDGPCEENRPYTVTESVEFEGFYDRKARTLTGTVVHSQQSDQPEVRLGAGGVEQLESQTIVRTTGELNATWSEAERRFSGTMAGTETTTSTYWDYEPGPGFRGRHQESRPTKTRDVTWSVRSAPLDDPLEVTVPAGGEGGTGTAAGGTDETGAPADEGDDAFPYLVVIAALLVALGIAAAAVVMAAIRRSRRAKRERPERRGGPTLDLTFPAGASPKVFTEGWVFGARCIANAGTPEQVDLSDEVEWSGSGTFTPPVGRRSRPTFGGPGANTINLTASYEGQPVTRSFTVQAVSPAGYAHVGSRARCPADAHGGPCCPHDVKGPVAEGSPTVLVDGRPAARVGDGGFHDTDPLWVERKFDELHSKMHDAMDGGDPVFLRCCGSNTFTVAAGDPEVLIDGRPAARIGDGTKHCGGIGTLVG